MICPLLAKLLAALRPADDVDAVLRASADRATRDAAYRDGLRAELAAVFLATHSTHPLTEDGILADEGILAGSWRRLGAWLAPAPVEGAGLQTLLRRGDERCLRRVSVDAAEAWAAAVIGDADVREDPAELAAATVILATRIAGAGMDALLTERLPDLESWRSPFLELTRTLDDYAELAVRDAAGEVDRQRAFAAIDRCVAQVEAFRDQKKVLGTTLHLSSRSLRMLQQLRRLRLLVACSAPDSLRPAVTLALDLLRAASRRRPTLHFIGEKLELLAYLAVGHAAQKGEHYAARKRSDLRRFLYKSGLGGVLVAVFACLKIHLSHEGMAPVPQALIYGFNYALCFVLIYLLGATLATKQPALTASRLSRALESGSSQESFAYLVRAIWRTQFLSFVGNIGGAALFSLIIAAAFGALTGSPLVTPGEAATLGAKLDPVGSGSLFYAGLAGVLLSAAGFLAGFVDNAVIFHRVGDRLRAGSGIFRAVPGGLRPRLADRLEHDLGGLSGNVALGFFLGSAGALGVILGLPIDIRHIAFASSHATLAVVYGGGPLLLLLLAVLLIGLVNFAVSFGLTLAVAVSARQVEGVAWRGALASLWRLAVARPLLFFLPLAADPPEARIDDDAGA